jgi:RNA polymerase sigma-70 factor, ECF subfamily
VLVENAEESSLIAQAIAGDALSMQRMLHSHRTRLLSYIRKHLPVRITRIVDPEDVLQESYFEACRQIGHFKPQGADCFFRWLAAIARNHMLDLLRRQRALKRGGDAEQYDQQQMVSVLEELAIHKRTPSKSAARHELMAALEHAIERLPDDYRLAVTLRYVQGMAIPDVAQHFGRSEGAVSMLLNRGLQALRLELKSMSNFV